MQTADNNKIISKVESFCAANDLLSPECARVVAAVSGGADSMALLFVLLLLRARFGYELSVCHVNHGLRGVSADADEAFVRDTCARLGVPLRVFHARDFGEIPPHAGENWARQLRYACFERVLKEAGGQGITVLATAHTATDQAETLLFRLARGTGLHGAAGIRPARGQYIRPLLCLSRAETESFCSTCGQGWVTDETNETNAYARNRLRHAALPALRSTNSAAEQNLAAFCEKAARADAYFVRESRNLMQKAQRELPRSLPAGARYAQKAGWPVWSICALQQADELILETALHGLVSPVRDAEQKYMTLLRDIVRAGTGAVQLVPRVRFCAEGGVLWREESLPAENVAKRFVIPFCPETRAEYSLPDGRLIKTSLEAKAFQEKTQRIHKKDLKNRADYAKISSLYPAPVLRTRLAGDKYAPFGRGVSKDLRKWMNEAGIPPHMRGTLPLLASGSRVLWVCGAGFAQGLAPEDGCTQVLQIWEEVEP